MLKVDVTRSTRGVQEPVADRVREVPPREMLRVLDAAMVRHGYAGAPWWGVTDRGARVMVASPDQAIWDDGHKWGSVSRSVWALYHDGWTSKEWLAARTLLRESDGVRVTDPLGSFPDPPELETGSGFPTVVLVAFERSTDLGMPRQVGEDSEPILVMRP